jgi:hypothetical protein
LPPSLLLAPVLSSPSPVSSSAIYGRCLIPAADPIWLHLLQFAVDLRILQLESIGPHPTNSSALLRTRIRARARTDQVEAHRSSARWRALTEPHAAAARSYPAAATTSSTASTSSTSRSDVSTELHHSRVGPTFSASATGGGAHRRMWTELPGGSDDYELPAAATSSSFCAGNPRSSSAPASSILRACGCVHMKPLACLTVARCGAHTTRAHGSTAGRHGGNTGQRLRAERRVPSR